MASIQAKIKCPHCHKEITVRQKMPFDTDKLWAAVDEMFENMNDGFKKINRIWRTK